MEEGVKKVVYGKLPVETSSPVSLTSLWRALIAGKTAEGRDDDDDGTAVPLGLLRDFQRRQSSSCKGIISSCRQSAHRFSMMPSSRR